MKKTDQEGSEEQISVLKEGLEEEQTREAMLDVLEKAFNEQSKVALTILEPNGDLKTSDVFIEGLEKNMLYVALSESSAVQGIPLNDVKGAR